MKATPTEKKYKEQKKPVFIKKNFEYMEPRRRWIDRKTVLPKK